MDYSQLLNRAWNLVWEHKFLILLGVLVALGSAGGGRNNFGAPDNSFGSQGDNVIFQLPSNIEFPFPDNVENFGLPVPGIVAIVIFIGFGLVVGLALWVLSGS